MGLGISIKGDTDRSPSFKEAVTLGDIAQCIGRYTTGIFHRFLVLEEREFQLFVTLHPCEQPVQFIRIETTFYCEAKTNNVGPGYHAYLVELLDKIGEALDIHWNWDLEEDGEYYCDDTGYQSHRDFDLLQMEMLKWLQEVCAHYIQKDNEQHMISFPLGYPRPKHGFFAASPTQFWTKDWFDLVATADLEELEAAGQAFFIWWNKEPDALFLRQTGISLLNVDCPWHYPLDDEEEALLQLIDTCFTLSVMMDPSYPIPQDDWEAVRLLLDHEDTDIPRTYYGYRKSTMTMELADNWTIDVPGTFYQDIDDEAQIFHDLRRTIRCVCYTSSTEADDKAFVENFFNTAKHKNAEYHYSQTHISGKGLSYFLNPEPPDEDYCVFQGLHAYEGSFLLTTMCYPSPNDLSWVLDTWNSIRRIAPQEDPPSLL